MDSAQSDVSNKTKKEQNKSAGWKTNYRDTKIHSKEHEKELKKGGGGR